MTLDFLLEIGTEEIPDWMIVPALGDLRERFEKLLAEHKLGGGVAWCDATPRRLRVEFLRRVRAERKFATPEALKAQILRDVGRAQEFWRRLKRWVRHVY